MRTARPYRPRRIARRGHRGGRQGRVAGQIRHQRLVVVLAKVTQTVMKGRIHLAIHRALRGHAMRDELPQVPHGPSARGQALGRDVGGVDTAQVAASQGGAKIELTERAASRMARSEENTSELQSLMRISYAVVGLKKKKDS